MKSDWKSEIYDKVETDSDELEFSNTSLNYKIEEVSGMEHMPISIISYVV